MFNVNDVIRGTNKLSKDEPVLFRIMHISEKIGMYYVDIISGSRFNGYYISIPFTDEEKYEKCTEQEITYYQL